MLKRKIGVVAQLWRYPVKSMLGEQRERLEISELGTAGDRVYAVRNADNGRVVSAKKWARMLELSADADEAGGRVTITLPDGTQLQADHPEASSILSRVLGFAVRLAHRSQAHREKAEIDPATVFGDVPVNQIYPGIKSDTLPDTFNLPPGSYFDSAAIHVLTSGTLRHLLELQGGTARLDPRRFRPNILVETDPALTGFVEDSWNDGVLAVGDLRINRIRAALRCVMTTHAQAGLPRDLSVLRTAAAHHQATVGAFGWIKTAGTVRIGDEVFLLK